MYTANNLALIGKLRTSGGVWLMSLRLEADILAGAPRGELRHRAAAAGDVTIVYQCTNNNKIHDTGCTISNFDFLIKSSKFIYLALGETRIILLLGYCCPFHWFLNQTSARLTVPLPRNNKYRLFYLKIQNQYL